MAISWRVRLQFALLKVENAARVEAGLPELPDNARVHFPGTDSAARILQFPQYIAENAALLNLYVWTKRYNVTPEFILEVLLRRFGRMRKVKANEKNHTSKSIRLGLSVSVLTGPEAKAAVEEEVARQYPNGEQWGDMSQNKRLYQMVPKDKGYAAEIAVHRRATSDLQNEKDKRNYRKIPTRVGRG